MTVVTTRPDEIIAGMPLAGFAATPSGTRYGVTSDNSDSTYMDGAAGDAVSLGFTEPTIPAGGLVKSLSVRARSAQAATGTQIIVALVANGVSTLTYAFVDISWAAITTTTVIPPTAYSTAPASNMRVTVNAAAGQPNIYELYVDTTYVAKPVVAPSAPTGTVTTTNAPTVTWANTLDSDGGPQTHYQVRVFTDAQYGAGGFNAASSTATWDSGDTASGSLSAQVPGPLADDTYRAYVRVGQTVNGVTHWSDYAYTQFTIDTDNPATPDTPVLTVQAGRIKIDLSGNTGAATTTHMEVQRSTDGSTWETTRTLSADSLFEGSSGTVYDYEAPNGTLMRYRVRALHDYTGSYTYSDWSATATATWVSDDWWLKCPEQPGLNMVVNLASLPGHQRVARHGVFQPLGSTRQVVVADTRGGSNGTLAVRLDTAGERDDLDALLDANATLLLQGPAAHDEPDRYLRFGNQDRRRWIDKSFVTGRVDTLDWIEVAQPAGPAAYWP